MRFDHFSGGEIFFLAARHSVDRASPTHQLVRHLLSEVRPDSVVLEGFFGNPPRLPPDSLGPAGAPGIEPENRFAYGLALELGIQVVGGDLSPAERARASLRNGFELDDVVGSHMLRVLSGRLSPGRIKATEQMVRRHLESVLLATDFSFEDWFLRTFGLPVSEDSIDAVYRGPCGSGIVAEIISFEGDARDQKLMSVLRDEASEKSRIAVIFGANHLYGIFDSLSAESRSWEIDRSRPAAGGRTI